MSACRRTISLLAAGPETGVRIIVNTRRAIVLRNNGDHLNSSEITERITAWVQKVCGNFAVMSRFATRPKRDNPEHCPGLSFETQHKVDLTSGHNEMATPV